MLLSLSKYALGSVYTRRYFVGEMTGFDIHFIGNTEFYVLSYHSRTEVLHPNQTIDNKAITSHTLVLALNGKKILIVPLLFRALTVRWEVTIIPNFDLTYSSIGSIHVCSEFR